MNEEGVGEDGRLAYLRRGSGTCAVPVLALDMAAGKIRAIKCIANAGPSPLLLGHSGAPRRQWLPRGTVHSSVGLQVRKGMGPTSTAEEWDLFPGTCLLKQLAESHSPIFFLICGLITFLCLVEFKEGCNLPACLTTLFPVPSAPVGSSNRSNARILRHQEERGREESRRWGKVQTQMTTVRFCNPKI